MCKRKIKLGVIADDFTGAGDAASFLVKNGYKTIMVTELQENLSVKCDCIVVALKIRSVKPQEAIFQVQKTLDFFKRLHVEKVYYKYCSTFDSTPKGNIGVVLDYLMDMLDIKYTVLCPSLPVNGRKVKNGVIYVHNVPLAESSMRNHPLNPMWDSYIPNLMREQSKYNTYVVDINNLSDEINKMSSINERFYVVPNYETDEQGKEIARVMKDLSLFSGGSGLLEHIILDNVTKTTEDLSNDVVTNKAIVICGSCSIMTRKQINKYISNGCPSICVNSLELLDGKITAEKIFARVIQNLPETTIIYSDGVDKDMKEFSRHSSFRELSNMIEKLNADLSCLALENGFNRIVVAGGETSGAVTIRLGYKAYYVGKMIAPGVPILTPLENTNLKLILKSGNFGDESFFIEALK